ncbi:MAG TPA: LPS export ABC transporter periplasmic protein LptC [Fimbriimonadaceae bacterium]|nr:LPS export ABC transporter periplasmic protein LptC [Fimbriimonadaceae bacterium]
MEREVNTGVGEVIRRSDSGQEDLWKVSWKSAKLEYTDDSRFGGAMNDVSGVIYENGKPVSQFTATEAVASKEDNILLLSGEVKVTSVKPEGTLSCEEVRYDGEKRRIEASGNVRVDSGLYSAGSFERVYARPDLTMIATPEWF